MPPAQVMANMMAVLETKDHAIVEEMEVIAQKKEDPRFRRAQPWLEMCTTRCTLEMQQNRYSSYQQLG